MVDALGKPERMASVHTYVLDRYHRQIHDILMAVLTGRRIAMSYRDAFVRLEGQQLDVDTLSLRWSARRTDSPLDRNHGEDRIHIFHRTIDASTPLCGTCGRPAPWLQAECTSRPVLERPSPRVRTGAFR